ncbi:MAG: ImmA/IrrE family metallo-endopeptidase [Nitrososphaerota archaeon]
MEAVAGLHVPRVPGIGHLQAERLGLRIVRDYRADLLVRPIPFPVEDFFEFYLFERYRLRTGPADLPPWIEGITYPDGTICISASTYEALYKGHPRARFTAVHEAVHGILHRPFLQHLQREWVDGRHITLYRRHELPPYTDPEWQANRIAEAILMPLPVVLDLIRQHGPDPWRLAVTFNVSYSAARVRISHLRRLGLISPGGAKR